MKTRTATVLTLILTAALSLASCYPAPQAMAPPAESQPVIETTATAAAQAPQESVAAPQETAAIANPASQNCISQGGKLEIEERGDGAVTDGAAASGAQFGVCYFEDNLQCEEWALMRGECPVGGVKVTGYTTPAARYCAITGGEYVVTDNGGQADEQGACTLKNGSQCEAWSFYNGECLAVGDGTVPIPTPAPASPALQIPIAEVCNGMAQALLEAASRAATPPSYVEVTQSDEPVPLTDPSTMASGTACRATVTGTGAEFAGPDAIVKEITAVLTGGGWEEDMQLASGGPTGMGSGYRSGDLVCIAGAIWHPDASANCPTDKPISECKVTPEQQLYTITIDCAQATAQMPQEGAAMVNPASQNCIAQGGKLEIEERGDGAVTDGAVTDGAAASGGQFGVCYFEDNRQCEEWALLRGECPAGGVKVTGYNTPAARYCAITGGTYTITGTTPDGMEAGDCALPNGEVCYVWHYYNRYCGAPAGP